MRLVSGRRGRVDPVRWNLERPGPNNTGVSTRQHRFWRFGRFVLVLPAAVLAAAAPVSAASSAEPDRLGAAAERVREGLRAPADWAGRAAAWTRGRWSEALAVATTAHDDAVGLFGFDADAGVSAGDRAAWPRVSEGGVAAPGGGRVVVLVHGLDESGDIWTDLAPALHGAGHVVLRFDYHNDGDPACAARLLRAELDGLAPSEPTGTAAGSPGVAIVAHSMGGLVAFDALTLPASDGGDAGGSAVDRLVTLGTPWDGSPWARLRVAGEVRDALAGWCEGGKDPRLLLMPLVDGSGEAGAALEPGSAYLSELSSRPAPEAVAVASVVGRMSPVDGGDLAGALEWAGVAEPERGPIAGRLVAAADRGAALLGDGVVPERSARSGRAGEVIHVDANHRTMVRRVAAIDAAASIASRVGLGDGAGEPPAIPIVLDLLRADEEADDDGGVGRPAEHASNASSGSGEEPEHVEIEGELE